MAAFSPLSLLDLPTELKFLLLSNLDARSLVNMSMTCKSINELIYASHRCNLVIEMAKSELLPTTPIGSSAIARRRIGLIQVLRTSHLTLPVETLHCDLIIPPDARIDMERLFQGLLACITDDSRLHVWDIRHNHTRPPRKVLMISETETKLMDVLIEPRYDLLVLLCYHSGNNCTSIKLLKLTSGGTQPYPWVTPRPMTVPEEAWSCADDRQFLTLHGPLLALVYNRPNPRSHKGIIWDWRTGNRVYDSTDFNSISTFHDLLLLTSWSFLVTVSTPSNYGPPTDYRAWIELRTCGSPASHLVAEFHLPEFDETEKYSVNSMSFYASEPPSSMAYSNDSENGFPFVSDPSTSVQVLHIWYRSRHTFRGASGVDLVISNRVFEDVLQNWLRRNVPDNDTSFPLRIGWDEWGPPWTSMWESGQLGRLSEMSSICGSRICSASHPADGCIELFVVDFNMNFPCTQRNCTDPSVHFSPKSSRSSKRAPLWAHVVHTWLPFHTQCKRITIPSTDDDWVMCAAFRMDEERIVLSTCPSESEMDPTCWRIIHLLCDRQDQSISLLTWSEDIEYIDERLPTRMQDGICRLCKEKPHTDAHILLECTAHTKVVELRQNLIEHIRRHHPALYGSLSRHSFDQLLNEIKVRTRGERIRILISSLVTEINKIYEQLPRCSELVMVEKDKPAFFVTIATFRY